MKNRKETLKEFLKEDPTDPFNWYALALELKNSEQDNYRLQIDQLLQRFPDYLPTYYQAGELYIDLNQVDKATTILEKGIALAKSQHNSLTQRELQNLLNNLLFDD